MIEFKINKDTYKIDRVTIRQYYQIYTKMVQVTPTTQLEIVSALSNCPIDVLKQLEQLQFAQIWAELVNGPLDLAQTKQFHKHIELHGKLYGFLDIKQLTIGEVADMDVLSKDPRKDQELHKMMAILYRPAINITDDWVVTEEYKAEGVAERAELFLDMPVEYVYSALAFFLLIRKYSIETMLDSLTETEEMTTEEREMVQLTRQITLELLETGTTHSSNLQAETLSKLERLQSLAQSMPSISSPIARTKPKKKSLSMTGLWHKLTQKDKHKL
jgi:hypothetical protein